MSSNYNLSEYHRSVGDAAVEMTNTMVRKVYLWMCAALALTGLTAYMVAGTPDFVRFVFGGKWTFLLLVVAEFALVIWLTAAIDRLSSFAAVALFGLYSIVNGVTLSSIFLVYELGSITSAFISSAAVFGVMAVYGSFTRKDLTRIGGICLMAVLGLIIAILVNLFLKNTLIDMLISGVGVLIFTGLTAYDAQKVKNLLSGAQENEVTSKMAVLGALTIYLDFINLFLYLLRIFGQKK